MKRRTIKIGKGRYAGRTNSVIQTAVDELAGEGGGTVELPAGTFKLADALHLRTGVSVTGQGSDTVLRKVPSVASPIVDYLGYGHYEITLKHPGLFKPGMGVIILDDDAPGFYTTTATLLARDGNTFFIDRMLNHDYDPAKGGCVISVFPLVSGECVQNIAISNLTLDGNNDPVTINGCRGGGVFFLGAHNAMAEGVEVMNYNGDAVGCQQCTDVVVRDCHIHQNAGIGMHPGSGSVRYLLTGNNVHDNGGEGIFYCLRTTHSLCEGNTIRDNAGVGISIGERDTDHIIRENQICGNGGPAVLFRPPRYRGADRVLLEDNHFAGNCVSEGNAEVVIASGINDVVLRRNSFDNIKGKALGVGESASGVHLVGNTVEGRKLSKKDIRGPSGRVVFGSRARALRPPKAGKRGLHPPTAGGPGAADAGSTRHLAVELPRLPANFEL